MLKKVLIFVTLACVFITTDLAAQHISSSFTIKAQATVVDQAEIEMVTIQNLHIEEGMAQDGVIYVSAQRDPEAGVVKILGKPEAHFRVQYIPERVIENMMGEGTLVVNYELYGYESELQYASEAIDAAERIMIISQIGEYYFWIGGRIDISNASPGNYYGEFTIEIEYL